MHTYRKKEFQPTRPLRGATGTITINKKLNYISTHAPLAGRDQIVIHSVVSSFLFQPTRPLRGATSGAGDAKHRTSYFNPRAPCGARLATCLLAPFVSIFQPTRPLRGATVYLPLSSFSIIISTHAPLAGRDHKPRWQPLLYSHFNPRAPCGARRSAPRRRLPARAYFNPRAPCGARPYGSLAFYTNCIFQPTRPLRGATEAS